MKGFIKGILFGSLVGGIGGLLLAPRSGKETQEKIREELDDWTDLKDNYDESLARFKQSLADFQDTAEATIEPFVKGINRDLNNFAFQAEPRLEQIQKQLEKIQEELPDLPEYEDVDTDTPEA